MSSQTDHRRLYEPQSNALNSYYQSPNGKVHGIYGNAHLENIPVQPVKIEMTSVQEIII